jgi:peptide/nickel transport system substrate-binding protein
MNDSLCRRVYLTFVLASLVIVAATAGCGTPTTPMVVEKPVVQTVIVEREKVVEKPVIQTVVVAGTPQVVEKVVTATPQPKDTSKYGGTLVIQSGGLVQFDPIFVADDNSFHVVSNVFSLLFRRQGPELFPDLAASWEYEDDRTLIFHLREGVMWHDDNAVFAQGASRKVVADDVVYSIQRAVETEGNTTAADFVGSYESVQALDDHTVRLTLKAPHALLFTLGRGLSGMAIVPREAVEQLGEDFALNPIGSGPFKFVEYKPDESLTLERNDLYWKKPYLDQVIYKVIPDQDAAVIALETGEVDILGSVPNADFERLNADNRFVLYPGGCPIMVQLVFNMTNPLHSQLQFRQAVAYALDGDAIDANVYGGMHVSGCGTAGPGVPGYDPNLCKYFPYDPEGARALLKELGWEDTDGDGVLDKDGEPMEFPLEIWSMSPMPQFGAAVATQLKEIGIPVELQTVEFGTWIADWNAGVDKAMIMSGWCGDGGMNGLWGGEGMARAMGYDDAEVFELLESANTLVDPAERDKTLRAAADKIYSQYWAVPMGFHNFFQASRSWVHDFHGTLWFQNLCTEGNNVWLTK